MSQLSNFSEAIPKGTKKATLLATKKLSAGQRELLLNRGFGLVEANFISIVPLDFTIKEIPENLIFTSKNSVNAILSHPQFSEFQKRKVFCVGDKTAELLIKNGFKVAKKAHYGAVLASEIIKDKIDGSFLFFCGIKRHDALPDGLKAAGMPLSEVKVYDTLPTPKNIIREFDGILFFSPSAVKSFCSKNDILDTPVFCIGTTTAAEVKKHTQNIVLSSIPTIESVIVSVVKYFEK